MNNEIVRLRIPGVPALQVAGEYIILKPFCENIGLEYTGQIQRLKRMQDEGSATMGMIPTVGSDGKTREMLGIHKDDFRIFLLGIDTSRMRNREVAEKIVVYKREVKQVLDDYYEKGENEMQMEMFHGKNVRTEVKNNKVWFNLSDVHAVLGAGKPSDTVNRLKESYVDTIDTPTQYGVKPMHYVSERGLIRVLHTSRSPLAEPFQDWADERVEQLMNGKTVNTAGVVEEQFALPQTYSEALRALADEAEAHAKTKEVNLALEAQNREMAPKVNRHDAFLDSDRQLHISNASKAYKEAGIKIGRSGLNGLLSKLGMVYDSYRGSKDDKHVWRVRTEYQRRGLLVEHDSSTATYNSYSVRITPNGFFHIYEMLADLQGVDKYVPRETLVDLVENN